MSLSVRTWAMVCMALTGSALAASDGPEVIGWWRMEASIGQAMAGQVIPNAAGDADRFAGVGHTWDGGMLRAYHELPGRYVYDPISGQAHENRSSIRFATSNQTDGRGRSDYIEIDQGIGRLQPASFTIEGFMKFEGGIDKWHEIIVLREPDRPHPHAWSLSTENLKGARKLRYGGHKAPRGYWGSFQDTPSVTQPGWHHFAYVFESTADGNKARLYWDGQLQSESSPASPAYAPTQRLYLGGAPGAAGWSGYLDEVRLTAAALTPEQFLQASDTPGKPEAPATPIALGLRAEAPKPLDQPVRLDDLPRPRVGPAAVDVPEDAGLVNVKTDYGAKGDGMTDDTAAIRQAVVATVGRHQTLYFPPGVYVVSEPIEWRNAKGEFHAFLTWQGAGMGRTFIYLRDGSVGFGAAETPEAITRPGSIPGMGGANPVTGAGNRAHNNYIMDMTFVVGRDNPGAIGVDFNASNTGAMENVRIIALDQAAEGLRLTRAVGCLLIKNLEVHGFDVGVRLGGDLYGSTLTNLHLQGQTRVGLLNEGHTVALQGLHSVNAVPAVRSLGRTGSFTDAGLMVLIDSHLTGGAGEHAAIENDTSIVARNVRTAGYGAALRQGEQTAVAGSEIDEYVWPEPITRFDAPPRTLGLPVTAPPAVPDIGVDQWVNVGDFGAQSGREEDQAPAIQRAIDSGAKVLYFPRGTYWLMSPIVVRGRVERMIGYQSWFRTPGDKVGEEALVRFENDRPVSFERFNLRPMLFEIATDAPVAFRHVMGLPEARLSHDQATVFSENTVGGRIALRAGQSWRAWQLNIEKGGPPAMIENHGGTFWVLGYKTEIGNTVLRTIDGGRSEVLGGLWYPAQGVKNPDLAAIEIENASVSVSLADLCKGGGQYQVEIREKRGSQTREVRRSDLPRRWGLSGSLSLYRSTP